MTTGRSTEVDGVPVLVAATPGPIRAGLVFRVGRVDESLATGGITNTWSSISLCTDRPTPTTTTTR